MRICHLTALSQKALGDEALRSRAQVAPVGAGCGGGGVTNLANLVRKMRESPGRKSIIQVMEYSVDPKKKRNKNPPTVIQWNSASVMIDEATEENLQRVDTDERTCVAVLVNEKGCGATEEKWYLTEDMYCPDNEITSRQICLAIERKWPALRWRFHPVEDISWRQCGNTRVRDVTDGELADIRRIVRESREQNREEEDQDQEDQEDQDQEEQDQEEQDQEQEQVPTPSPNKRRKTATAPAPAVPGLLTTGAAFDAAAMAAATAAATAVSPDAFWALLNELKELKEQNQELKDELGSQRDDLNAVRQSVDHQKSVHVAHARIVDDGLASVRAQTELNSEQVQRLKSESHKTEQARVSVAKSFFTPDKMTRGEKAAAHIHPDLKRSDNVATLSISVPIANPRSRKKKMEMEMAQEDAEATPDDGNGGSDGDDDGAAIEKNKQVPLGYSDRICCCRMLKLSSDKSAPACASATKRTFQDSDGQKQEYYISTKPTGLPLSIMALEPDLHAMDMRAAFIRYKQYAVCDQCTKDTPAVVKFISLDGKCIHAKAQTILDLVLDRKTSPMQPGSGKKDPAPAKFIWTSCCSLCFKHVANNDRLEEVVCCKECDAKMIDTSPGHDNYIDIMGMVRWRFPGIDGSCFHEGAYWRGLIGSSKHHLDSSLGIESTSSEGKSPSGGPDTYFSFKANGVKSHVFIEEDSNAHNGGDYVKIASNGKRQEFNRMKALIEVGSRDASHVFIIRYVPTGEYQSDIGKYSPSKKLRMVLIRTWIVWFMSRVMTPGAFVPPVTVLYMFYPANSDHKADMKSPANLKLIRIFNRDSDSNDVKSPKSFQGSVNQIHVGETGTCAQELESAPSRSRMIDWRYAMHPPEGMLLQLAASRRQETGVIKQTAAEVFPAMYR